MNSYSAKFFVSDERWICVTDNAFGFQSLTLQRDSLRECLEKDPSERTEDDIEILLELTQHLKAFTNMTLAVRRALCSVMVSICNLIEHSDGGLE